MQYIAQQTFLKQFLEVGTLLTFSPQFSSANDDKEAFFEKIVKANYQEVTKLIIALEPEITEIRRRLVFDFTNLSAALAELISRFYQKDALVTYIQYFLIKYQKTDGTLDLENLASQPDTAFILEPICAAALILRKLTMPAL